MGVDVITSRVICRACGNEVTDERIMKTLGDAKKAEASGRYEDAAKLFEELNCNEKARELRAKDVAMRNTTRSVTVDLNSLIEQLRSHGLAIPYKCGSCGATIAIGGSSNAAGLKFCSYCGSAFDAESLVRLLTEALK